MHPNPRLDPPSVAPPLATDGWRKAALVRDIAAHVFQVAPEELAASTRQRAPAALARQVAMYVCHVVLGISYREVGGFFGRDRTTASHACKVIEERRDEREFDDTVRRIEEAVRALGIAPPPRFPAFGCR